jgi:predicted amidohydrolase
MSFSAMLAQFPVSKSIPDNLATILSLLENAQAGELVIFPEGAVSGYGQDLNFLRDIDPKQLNAALEELRNQAQKKGICLWVGSLIPQGDVWYNAAFGFTANGGGYQYRKVNLARHERGTLAAGSDLPVFEMETAEGVIKLGVQICRELRYPEQWGWLARQGAQVYLHLNNAVSHPERLSVWRSHLVSHAAANQRYVLSVNNAAPEQTCPTMAVSPGGQVIDEIVSSRPSFIRINIDLSSVSDQALHQSRPDIVCIDVPSKKDRRRIMRSMKVDQLGVDLAELEGNPNLNEESQLSARTEALGFIDIIEDMYRVRSRDRELQSLYQRAMVLRKRLERSNAGLFASLRRRIQRKEITPKQLRDYFKGYTDYDPVNPGRPHYGYEDLDGLISGVLFPTPTPQEAKERLPGMIRYQPTPASVILEMIDQVALANEDVFYDLGSGLGLVISLVSLLTGVTCVGVEYQTSYCRYARESASKIGLEGTTFINADAQDVDYSRGTVFFMFNPFGGRIFDNVMGKLQVQAHQRKITVCSYGPSTTPLAALPWLDIRNPDMNHEFKLAIFTSKSGPI